MRKLARVLLCGFAVLFLVACPPSAREKVDREDPATVLTVERLDFPKYGGSAADALQFEVEYSDGTKVGCVYIWSGVSCVALQQPGRVF